MFAAIPRCWLFSLLQIPAPSYFRYTGGVSTTTCICSVEGGSLEELLYIQLFGICRGVKNQKSTLLDGFCFNMTLAERAAFPTFAFRLGKGTDAWDLEFGPDVYLQYTYNCATPGEVGMWIFKDEVFAVLGAKLLQKYYTVFDGANARMGFVEANGACSVSPVFS